MVKLPAVKFSLAYHTKLFSCYLSDCQAVASFLAFLVKKWQNLCHFFSYKLTCVLIKSLMVEGFYNTNKWLEVKNLYKIIWKGQIKFAFSFFFYSLSKANIHNYKVQKPIKEKKINLRFVSLFNKKLNWWCEFAVRF